MNFRLLTLTTAAAVGLSFMPAMAEDAAVPYTVDATHTQIMFKIGHMGFSKTYGRFKVFEAELDFDPASPEDMSIEVIVDTSSIDSDYGPRDTHLRGEDYFNVEEFPTMTFKSTGVELGDDDTATMTGDLTLLGVTKSIELNITLNGAGPHLFAKGADVAGFAAKGTIMRSEFGMESGLPAISDEVTLMIQSEFNNRPPKN